LQDVLASTSTSRLLPAPFEAAFLFGGFGGLELGSSAWASSEFPRRTVHQHKANNGNTAAI
jgi:hypothetical protein